MNYKIKDISKIINGATPSTGNSDFWNGDIEWITPKDLTNFSGRYIFHGHAPITKEGYDSCSTKLVPKGTILLSSRAPIGYLAIAGCEVCTNQGFKSIICDKSVVNNLYLFYWLQTRVEYLQSISNGATFKELSKDTLENVSIDLPSLQEQQHIVNTIGSVDDLIENCEQKANKLFNIGLIKINLLNQNSELIKFTDIAKLEKGIEIGSSNYIEIEDKNTIHYLRVGDLESIQNTFIDKNTAKNFAKEDDILVAFDGAPGRNNIGLVGSYSSGIYKVVSENEIKGLLYFEINSELNQKIIKDHSQGTTILHASKSIPYLVSANCSSKDKEYLNSLFNELVSLKKKIICLKKNKNLLLNKYFTSQQ